MSLQAPAAFAAGYDSTLQTGVLLAGGDGVVASVGKILLLGIIGGVLFVLFSPPRERVLSKNLELGSEEAEEAIRKFVASSRCPSSFALRCFGLTQATAFRLERERTTRDHSQNVWKILGSVWRKASIEACATRENKTLVANTAHDKCVALVPQYFFFFRPDSHHGSDAHGQRRLLTVGHIIGYGDETDILARVHLQGGCSGSRHHTLFAVVRPIRVFVSTFLLGSHDHRTNNCSELFVQLPCSIPRRVADHISHPALLNLATCPTSRVVMTARL
eukprot:1780836-Rhodomonas_salina.6